MNCWHCGEDTPMIWGSDFSFEDIGLDGDGIVSFFTCSKCKCYAEVYLPFNEDEEEV